MAFVGPETVVSETDELSNIKSAILLLSNDSTNTTLPLTSHSHEAYISMLSEAFCGPVSVLSIYQASACLHEGHLRQAVQLLIFRGLTAVRPAIRLLTVMRGLAGNVELSLQLIDQVNPSEYTALDSRTLALIANQCGPKVPNFGHFVSSLLSRIDGEDSEDVKFALARVFQTFCDPPKEPEFAVQNWACEARAACTPSIWKELKWAEFARAHCVSNATSYHSSSLSDSDSRNFCDLTDVVGRALPHYVSVCGVWFRRRAIRTTSHASKMTSSPNQNDGDSTIVITPSLRTALRQIASVLSFGIPLVLEGPSGCGKTTVLSLLARKTIADVSVQSSQVDSPGVTFVQLDSIMSNIDPDSFSSLVGGVVPLPEGGGFRWRPGPVGLALERGDWLIFENVGFSVSSSSIAHLLSSLAELCPGDQFDAPGRGGPIRVALGFRCIVTRTIAEDTDNGRWEPPGGWELWRRVRIQGLSDQEIENVLRKRFPLVSDCIQRVMSAIASFRAYLSSNTGTSKVLPSLREALHICNRLNTLRHDGGVLTTEMAFLESFDVLLAWCPSGRHKSGLLGFLASCWSLPVDTAERLLSTNIPSLSRSPNFFRVGRAAVNFISNSHAGQLVRPKLCLNGHTLRLIEQILRCKQVGESVLLTGEAGSGKTAVIQEISSLLGKELTIVNLSRQSELSDLMGNFRPVEVAVMVPQLAKKFEQLFCEYMSRERNARFLDALQRAARASSHHERALRLIKGAMAAVPRHVKAKTSDALQRWHEISVEVESLGRRYSIDSVSVGERGPNSERPKKRPRRFHDDMVVRQRKMDFKFCDGVLVKAMRAGHWILLDEINLAPPDLLERLISVIDRGEASLSDEKGELVKSHPGFTIFGAMNPPTDIGKKPLPSALTVRFTELQVGEIESRKDIIDLILHRFFHRNISLHSSDRKVREEDELAESLATFFLVCLKIAKDGRVEDTTGKPVRYSIRTLTRSLDFANGVRSFMKPGSSSTRRSLYEGALVAFGTSLPRTCRGIIRDRAKNLLLGGSDGPSRLNGLYEPTSISSACMLEGFPLVSKRSASEGWNLTTDFIISPTVRHTLQQVCRVMLIGAPTYPILLQGPTAAGKTSIVVHLAEYTGNQLIRINNHEHTELSEYLGGYIATANGSLQFCEGPLVRAARLGEWVLLDELNLAPPDVLEALNRLLDDNREIFVPETGEIIKAAPGFRLFATQNPPGLYGGRKELSRAFRSRFVELQVDELPDEDLLLILEKRSSLPRSFALGMVSVMRELQMRRQTSSIFTGREGFVTARDLFRWSSRCPRSKEELAMHGFFLLGERARHSSEREIVRNVIVKSLRVSAEVLSDKCLYDFGDPSCFSQVCLDVSMKKLGLSLPKISATLASLGIASTPHTKRMLILIIHSMANKEPSLLVGPTGTGKTSCCFAICSALNLEMLSVNCHRHTESSDILGSFRPVRRPQPGGPLFEWCNGPLVDSMVKGSAVLIDEINMANDAVIERLNSVLEPKRTLLLSEKGSAPLKGCDVLAPEQIKAKDSFVVLATMNPGGDFGKKELSPALRNRFTEVWIPQPHLIEDYIPIVERALTHGYFETHAEYEKPAGQILTEFLSHMLSKDPSMENDTGSSQSSEQQYVLTLRDLKNWCLFASEVSSCSKFSGALALVHGARLVFLDGLSVGSAEGWQTTAGKLLWDALLALLPASLRSEARMYDFSSVESIKFERNVTATEPWCIEVGKFRVNRNVEGTLIDRRHISSFSFDAPNTLRNTARLARAMCVGYHPLLLEGPPGGGKTSLISALAAEAGFAFIRVNLSEATEISDLIGSDAPGSARGMFTFREGPLLKAMRQGSWLLLDELNLASQSVLEGLNSVLDHRREIYVPEIKENVCAHSSFRVFGAQNPASDGGGRRRLPRSFLNRFVKVWIEPPDERDILTILSSLHPTITRDVIHKIVLVLEQVRHKLQMNTSGVLGLRDALRWCDLLASFSGANKWKLYGEANEKGSLDTLNTSGLVGALFDVVVLQGIPEGSERVVAENIFESVFGHKWRDNEVTPVIRETTNGLRIGLVELRRTSRAPFYDISENFDAHTGPTNLRELQALSSATRLLWPVVLFSESPSKSRYVGRHLFELAAASCGKRTHIISGGSLTDVEGFIGGYCQQDVTWAVHHCLKGWRELLRKLYCVMSTTRIELMTIMRKAAHLVCIDIPFSESTSKGELVSFVESFLGASHEILGLLKKEQLVSKDLEQDFNSLLRHQEELKYLNEYAQTGHFASFVWRKSDLLQAIERGDWIFVQDADQCPPSVLDRINPLFERLPGAFTEDILENRCDEIIIAEAPSEENGSSMCIRPHSEFRMFFSVSAQGDRQTIQGLSRALLDRSLRIYISGAHSSNESAIIDNEAFRRYHDRFERASETKFGSSVKGSLAVCSRSIGLACDILPGSSERTPFMQTRNSQLVTDVRTVVVQRDLHALGMLEKSVGEIVSTSFTSLERFGLRDTNSQSMFVQCTQRELASNAARKLLCVSGLAFLFGASSGRDYNTRLKALTFRAEETSEPTHQEAYEYVTSIGRAVEPLRAHTTEGFKHALAETPGVPWDPVFALDRSALLFMSRFKHTYCDSVRVSFRAKQFRYELLAVQRLLTLWNRGYDSSREQSYRFSRAKTESSLREKGISLSQSSIDMDGLVFSAAKQIVEICPSLCNRIYQNDSYCGDLETHWLTVLEATVKLCENLLDDGSTTDKAFSSLFVMALSLAKLRSSGLLPAEMDGLTSIICTFVNHLERCLNDAPVLLMPTAKAGLSLESRFFDAILYRCREQMGVMEYRAVVRAIVTLRANRIEQNGQLFETFDKLASKIDNGPESSTHTRECHPIRHWKLSAFNEVVLQFRDMVLSLAFPIDRNALLERVSRVLERVTSSSSIKLLSAVSVQRMFWLVEENRHANDCYKPLLSDLLNELSATICNLGDEGTTDCSSSAISAAMELCKSDSFIPFWNLHNASIESVSAVTLTLCGVHTINVFDDKAIRLLSMSLMSALSDLGKVKEENGDYESIGINFSSIDEIRRVVYKLKPDEPCLRFMRNAVDALAQGILKIPEHLRNGAAVRHQAFLGVAWLCVGLTQLVAHFRFISKFKSVDPSDVSSSIMISTTRDALEALISQKAYAIVGGNRLGGEDPNRSEPVLRLQKQLQQSICLHGKAQRRYVQRPLGKLSFKFYESAVLASTESVSRIFENGLFTKVKSFFDCVNSRDVRSEIESLLVSCRTTAKSLQCNGSLSHFRDCSSSFELGLRECEFGLACLRKSFDNYAQLANPKFSSTISRVSALLRFPYHAFPEPHLASAAIQKCIKLSLDGSSLMALAEYFVSISCRDGFYDVNDISFALEKIYSAWKLQLQADEKAEEKKSSLHVLREESIKNDVVGGDFIASLEVNEEHDFRSTFNPIDEELEHNLFGANIENEGDFGRVEETPEDVEIDGPVKVNPELFFELHTKIFPANFEGDATPPGTPSYVGSMSRVCGHLHSVANEISENLDISTVWSSVCSLCIARQFVFENRKDPYNFYLDPNISELAEVSIALQSLCSTIHKIQRTFFEETGDHPVLSEIEVAVEKISKSCRSGDALSKPVIAIEHVLRKIDQWHRLFSTKETRLDDDSTNLSRLVVRFRNLEMSCWPGLLRNRLSTFERKATKWFFLLYDVVVGQGLCSHTIVEDSMNEIVSSLDQFLRSSPVGEFTRRIEMLISVSNHLLAVRVTEDHQIKLGQILRGVALSYSIFQPGVIARVRIMEKDVYNKLNEFTKLVSWTATEDLGSSQVMFKQKLKHLEYYRLKAAAEKTRRRLHKLCLEMDAIYRQPVYGFISKELAAIGLQLITDENKSGKGQTSKSRNVTRFSEAITTACMELTFSEKLTPVDTTALLQFEDTHNDFLSRSGHLAAKINQYGEQLVSAKTGSVDQALICIHRLRKTINQRACELKALEGPSLQLKKRSFINLLHALRAFGLSPFHAAKDDVVNPIFCFSSPSPSRCLTYDRVANELYTVCVHHLRRLYGALDSRVRIPDISRDEASRMGAFCTQIFEQVHTQRGSLHECISAVTNVTKRAAVLNSLEFEPSKVSIEQDLSGQFDHFQKIRQNLNRIKSCLEDVRVVEQLLKITDPLSQSNLKTLSNDFVRSSSLAFVLRQIQDSVYNSEIRFLSEKAASCAAAIQMFIEDRDVIMIRSALPQTISFLDGRLDVSMGKVELHLEDLRVKCNTILGELNDVSPFNILTQTLKPIVEFLDSFSMALQPTLKAISMSKDEVAVILTQSSDCANNVLQCVLLSVQRIMNWYGVCSNAESIQLEQSKSLEDGLDFPNVLKSSYHKFISLYAECGLEALSKSMTKNEILLDTISSNRAGLNVDDILKIVSQQRQVGRFVSNFLNKIITPTMQKVARYHCNLMSLLRTLTSLFIGLSEEGYCRPIEEHAGEEENFQDVSGAGFGEASGGDMSFAQNVSNEVEDEEQLVGLTNDEQYEPNKERDLSNQNDEDAIDMTDDFDGELLDDQKNAKNLDENGEISEAERHLSEEHSRGKELVDERMWGQDDTFAHGENAEAGDGDENRQSEIAAELVAGEGKSDSKSAEDKVERDSLDQHAQFKHDTDIDASEHEHLDSDTKCDDENQNESTGASADVKKHRDGKPLDEDDLDESSIQEGSDREKEVQDDPSGDENGSANADVGMKEHGHPNNEQNIGTEPEEENYDTSDCSNGQHQRENNETDKTEMEGRGDCDTMTGEPNDNGEGFNSGDDTHDKDSAQGDLDSVDMDVGDLLEDGNVDDSELPCDEVSSGDAGVDENKDDNGKNVDNLNLTKTDSAEEEENVELAGSIATVPGMATTDQNSKPQHGANRMSVFSSEVDSGATLGTDGPERDAREPHREGMTGSGNSVKGANEGETQSQKYVSQPQSSEEAKREQRFLQDANPLRAPVDEDLVQHWEKFMEVVENEGSDEFKNDNPGGDGSAKWEFTRREDSNEPFDKIILAEATKEQHAPLPTIGADDDKDHESIREQEDGGKAMDLENKTSQAARDLLPRIVDQKNKGEDLGLEHTAREQVEKVEPETREHPARRAVESNNRDVPLDSNHTSAVLPNIALGTFDHKTENCTALGSNTNCMWITDSLNEEEACNLWRGLEVKVSHDASILCEQLRLVLEPTTASSLAGGYRTGKKLNMRRVIEYVASDFQKDRIWLRRTKADKRSYDVMVAIDDSASMVEGEGGVMALESVALLLSAMGKLEVGRVAVVSFGSKTRLVRDFDESLPISHVQGGHLLQHFNFSQTETDLVNLLDFAWKKMGNEAIPSGSEKEHLSLLFVISDGRLSNREEIKRYIRRMKDENILVAAVIIDKCASGNDTAKTGNAAMSGIFDVKRVEYDGSGNISVVPYMHDFPIAFYVVVQDPRSLPSVLSNGLKHWIEVSTI